MHLGFLFCFNLGFALLQTGNSAPALPPEGGFGSSRCLQFAGLSTKSVTVVLSYRCMATYPYTSPSISN